LYRGYGARSLHQGPLTGCVERFQAASVSTVNPPSASAQGRIETAIDG
jgi:hypothetical protein